MSVSPLTLAKKIKTLITNHPTLVARDGTGDVPKAFNFKFGGELLEAGKDVRKQVKIITTELYEELGGLTLPAITDTSREATKVRTTIFTFRALYSIHNSPNGLLKAKFQVRTYGIDELSDNLPFSWDAIQVLDGCSGVYQFKRHDEDENNPWVYSWIFTVDGVSVSRGTKQPIHKLITSLLKCVDLSKVTSPKVQKALATLAKMKAAVKPYHWFLSNKDTAMWYQAFSEYKSLTSCMSKPHSYYSHTGPRQHPMDCYDDSPDWSLMLLSDMLPEDIIEMCDLVIANPGDAATLFKFPWLTRCLVLPTALETSGHAWETPYVMGKFYGEEKLIELFYGGNSDSEPYHKNDNGLLSGSYHIDGGRIPAILTTRESEEGKYLLPYFDKANKARLIKEDGVEYWVSAGRDRSKYRDPIAKCVYDAGVAKFEEIWSPANNGYTTVNSYVPQTFDTIFGPEVEDYRSQYIEYDISGTTQLIPTSMFEQVEGVKALRGAITRL